MKCYGRRNFDKFMFTCQTHQNPPNHYQGFIHSIKLFCTIVEFNEYINIPQEQLYIITIKDQ